MSGAPAWTGPWINPRAAALWWTPSDTRHCAPHSPTNSSAGSGRKYAHKVKVNLGRTDGRETLLCLIKELAQNLKDSWANRQTALTTHECCSDRNSFSLTRYCCVHRLSKLGGQECYLSFTLWFKWALMKTEPRCCWKKNKTLRYFISGPPSSKSGEMNFRYININIINNILAVHGHTMKYLKTQVYVLVLGPEKWREVVVIEFMGRQLSTRQPQPSKSWMQAFYTTPTVFPCSEIELISVLLFLSVKQRLLQRNVPSTRIAVKIN